MQALRNPADVVFWSGAGASMGPPTLLPSGAQLTLDVLEVACGAAFAAEFAARIEAADLRDAAGIRKSMPRLEGVLQHVIPVLGADVALAPLAVVEHRPPNPLHHLFAAHVAARGRHLTTNFDLCVERALGGPSNRIAHLHGEYDAAALDTLGVEVVRLSRGLPAAQRTAIEDALTSCSQLVVCGYSGGDYFDVDPFLRGLRRRGLALGSLEVVWVDHGPPGPVAPGDPVRRRPMLRELEAMGAAITVVRGDTLALLTGATRHWRVAIPAPAPAAPPAFTRPRVTEWQQRRTQVAVLRAAGMGAEVLAIDRRLRRDRRPEARALREALRESRAAALAETGLYRRACWHVLRAPARTTEDRAHRAQVLGSYLRLRGNRLTGAALHRRAVLRYPRGSLAAPHDSWRGDALVEWLNWRRERAETRDGRLLRPLGRLEDALGGRGLDALDVWDELVADREYVASHPHAVAQLQRILEHVPELHGATVPDELEARFDERPSVYFESDSIVGYTNAERDRLRRVHRPPAQELERLRARSELVRDRPGVVKAALMQRRRDGRARFPWRELLTIGWSYPWKARFVVLWLLRRDWARN